MKRLDDIKARAEAATDGPWKWDNRRVPTLNGMAGSRDVYRYETEVIEADHNGECGCRSACQLDLTVGPADAEFIAHARTDVPALVAAVEAVLELHALGIGDLFTAEGIEARLAHCVECTQVEHKFVVRYPCPTVTAIRTALGEGEK